MKPLTVLGIETASRKYQAAVIEDGREVFRCEGLGEDRREVDDIVRSCLKGASLTVGDLDVVAVDVGPGNMLSVRSGVAFGCGLALGSGKSMRAVSAFQLMGVEAQEALALPILCSWRAADSQAYLGLYDNGAIVGWGFGHVGEIAPKLASSYDAIGLAGSMSEDVRLALPALDTIVSAVTAPSVRIFGKLDYRREVLLDVRRQIVAPMSEQSEVFR